MDDDMMIMVVAESDVDLDLNSIDIKCETTKKHECILFQCNNLKYVLLYVLNSLLCCMFQDHHHR